MIILMQTVTAQLLANKRVLLRMDLDVALKKISSGWQVGEDFRLKAGIPTLDLCLKNAASVIVMGHLGRPQGQDPNFSVKPIVDWLENYYSDFEFPPDKLHVLENLRFETGEDGMDKKFAAELAEMGDFFVNDSFAAYHKAASTVLLPQLLPHTAGLTFAKEVETLTNVKQHPQKPLIVIIGGAKIADKLPVVLEMSKIADAVLVGGKLPEEISEVDKVIPHNVLVGRLNQAKTDIAPETLASWEKLIPGAKMIVWNGPMGIIEDSGTAKGTYELAKLVAKSGAESIVGGGDTVSALDKWGMLKDFSFVSTGGGAMLKLLAENTLPTIEALS